MQIFAGEAWADGGLEFKREKHNPARHTGLKDIGRQTRLISFFPSYPSLPILFFDQIRERILAGKDRTPKKKKRSGLIKPLCFF
jgi:hypothetical protein